MVARAPLVLGSDGLAQALQPADTLGGVASTWTAFTPSLTVQTPGATPPVFSSVSAFYCQIGKIVFFKGGFTVTSVGTGTGLVTASIPVSATTDVQPIMTTRDDNGTVIYGRVGYGSTLFIPALFAGAVVNWNQFYQAA